MRKIILGLAFCLAFTAPGMAMDFSFSWGNIPKCTDGNPNRVDNPTFKMTGVPAGTESISFKMKDINVPSYNHGGGTAQYTGNTIAPGAFKYKSPCPPNGKHNYEWTAIAKDAAGKSLATARARKFYP